MRERTPAIKIPRLYLERGRDVDVKKGLHKEGFMAENGVYREFTVTVPRWICDLAEKLIAPIGYNEVTEAMTPLGILAVYIRIEGWDEQFFVYPSDDNGFIVELPVEGKKQARNIDEVVNLIRQHVKHWAQIRFKRAFP